MKTVIILLILSTIFVSIGNLMDITDYEKFLNISKHGYWNNGMFLLFLAIALEFYKV